MPRSDSSAGLVVLSLDHRRENVGTRGVLRWVAGSFPLRLRRLIKTSMHSIDVVGVTFLSIGGPRTWLAGLCRRFVESSMHFIDIVRVVLLHVVRPRT